MLNSRLHAECTHTEGMKAIQVRNVPDDVSRSARHLCDVHLLAVSR
jgi:hypothetical protein